MGESPAITSKDYLSLSVIIGHSQFEKIPISPERQAVIIQGQIDEIVDAVAEAKANREEKFTVKQMEKTKKNLEAKIKKLYDKKKDDTVTFEELGVDRLFVDEAHSFKNLYMHTKMRNVAGISQTDAQKSSDMFAKEYRYPLLADVIGIFKLSELLEKELVKANIVAIKVPIIFGELP